MLFCTSRGKNVRKAADLKGKGKGDPIHSGKKKRSPFRRKKGEKFGKGN